MKKHKIGFTLAEVLITLVIIGIIAAMTIPSIIQNTNKKELHTKFKKSYSTLLNAIRLAQVHEGTIGDNSSVFPAGGLYFEEAKNEATFKLSKYLNAVRVCKNSSDENCEDVYYYDESYFKDANYSAIVLSDGTIYKFLTMNGETLTVYLAIDVNGQKGPNKLNEDLFAFVIYKDEIQDLNSSVAKNILVNAI